MVKQWLSMLMLVLLANGAIASDRAVSKFRIIAKQVDQFIKSEPEFYDVSEYSRSPTGTVIIGKRLQPKNIRFDVKKTDSMINPIIGVISFEASVINTSKCGTVVVAAGFMQGAATPEEALDVSNRDGCWNPDGFGYGNIVFKYGYAETGWELLEIITEREGLNKLLGYAFGAPLIGRLPTNLNAKWLKLNYGLVNNQ